MKRHFTILALIFIVLLATTLVRAEAAPTFSVGTAEVPLDGEVTIDIIIADMPEEGLNTFGCTVTFDPNSVEVIEVSAGDWYIDPGNMLFLDNIDNTNGTVTFGGGMATGGIQLGTLATLTFKGKSITAPSSPVTLEVFEAKDSMWTDIVFTVSPCAIEVYQQYTLTVGASEGGTTAPEAGTYPYKAGTEVDLTATPNEGYRFYKWVIDATDVFEATTQVTMNENKTAQAYFYLPEVTTIKVSGDIEIVIPALGGDAVEKTYTATLKDQYGIEMTGAVTWSVEGDPAGVTIDQNGLLKVTDGAKDVTEVKVKATYGTGEDAVTGILLVSLVRATPILTTIEIEGLDSVIIPVPGGETITKYEAIGKDQYGADMTVTFTWSLAELVTGVAVNTETGEVTVDDTAEDGSSFTIQATSDTVTNSKTVQVVLDELAPATIEVSGTEKIVVIDKGATLYQYNAKVFDQYKDEMAEETVTWSVGGTAKGVSIDAASGQVTIEGSEVTDGQTFSVTATSTSVGTVTGQLTVALQVPVDTSTIVTPDQGLTEIAGPGGSRLVIPAGAVTGEDSVTISMTAIPEAQRPERPAGYGFIGGAGSLFTFDAEDYEFEQPLTIILSYADADPQPDPTKLKIVRWSDDGTGTITTEILDSTVDTVAKTISVTVTGFSDYGIMENVGVGSVEVTGVSSIAIPRSGEDNVTSEYVATVKDVGGNTMTGQEVTWSLAAPITGVSIDSSTGIVTITPAAKTGSITVVATSVALPDVKGEKIVEIYNEYILTVEVDGAGTVTPSEGQYRYKDGAIQSLTATASSGWIFEKWVVGEAEYSASSIDVTMDADKTATAYFLRSGTIKIVQDIPGSSQGTEEGEISEGLVTLVPEQVGNPSWSKTFRISVDDGTITSISGKLTFDPAMVSIDDVTSEYGTVTWNVVSGTMTFSLNVSEFTGGDLITIRARALQTGTESQFALAIDKWASGSVSGATVKNYLLGDVDKGFGVKPSDAMETLRFALGLTRFSDVDPILADVNNDLDVTTGDALNILRISVGLAPQAQ
jgi:hypothetical protein